MSTNTTQLTDIHFKVDATVKADAEATLQELGLSMSNYLNMALRQLNLQREIPFRATTKRKKYALPGAKIKTKEDFDKIVTERYNSFDEETALSLDEVKEKLEEEFGYELRT